jgi:hypothetical protein
MKIEMAIVSAVLLAALAALSSNSITPARDLTRAQPEIAPANIELWQHNLIKVPFLNINGSPFEDMNPSSAVRMSCRPNFRTMYDRFPNGKIQPVQVTADGAPARVGKSGLVPPHGATAPHPNLGG